jgi:hypothetical protein
MHNGKVVYIRLSARPFSGTNECMWMQFGVVGSNFRSCYENLILVHNSLTNILAHTATLLICVREVSVSNPGPVTYYPVIFRGFPQFPS